MSVTAKDTIADVELPACGLARRSEVSPAGPAPGRSLEGGGHYRVDES